MKKKWRNISSDTKKELSTARKEARLTGGVSAGEELNPIEYKIAETIGQTAIQGIPGGYDSADCTSTITQPVEHDHGEDR